MNTYPIPFPEIMIRALNRLAKTQARLLPAPVWRKVKAGDMLWVREKFKQVTSGQVKNGYGEVRYGIAYSANDSVIWKDHVTKIHDYTGQADTGPLQFKKWSWKQSIHMARWASRMTLEVKEVRREHLQKITQHDAWEEGVSQALELLRREEGELSLPNFSGGGLRAFVQQEFGSNRAAFHWLWNRLHKRRGERWEDNPEVFVIVFKVHHANIDGDRKSVV